MPQPFLHAGKNRLVVPGLDMDDAIRGEASLFQTRREQILLRHTPQNLARCSSGYPGHETGGGRTVDSAISAARDLMQTPKCQSATWQPPIQNRHAEGQNLPRARTISLQLRDAFTQRQNGWIEGARSHARLVLRGLSQWILAVMFLICSHSGGESI